MAHSNDLPKVHRYITSHNAQGQAIFHTGLADEAKFDALPDKMAFALGYTTAGFPADMNKDADIKVYETYLASPPGLTVSNGTVLRYVDFPPSNTPVMHRTVSLDFGVVLEGSIVCVLDSGEERVMGRDVCIQRGTMHAWRNTSDKEWCRMMFVLQPSKPLEISGQKFGEDLGNAVGIPESK